MNGLGGKIPPKNNITNPVISQVKTSSVIELAHNHNIVGITSNNITFNLSRNIPETIPLEAISTLKTQLYNPIDWTVFQEIKSLKYRGVSGNLVTDYSLLFDRLNKDKETVDTYKDDVYHSYREKEVKSFKLDPIVEQKHLIWAKRLAECQFNREAISVCIYLDTEYPDRPYLLSRDTGRFDLIVKFADDNTTEKYDVTALNPNAKKFIKNLITKATGLNKGEYILLCDFHHSYDMAIQQLPSHMQKYIKIVTPLNVQQTFNNYSLDYDYLRPEYQQGIFQFKDKGPITTVEEAKRQLSKLDELD